MKQVGTTFFILGLSFLAVFGQGASFQDCIGAIPICQQVYLEEMAPVGEGNINDIKGAINCNPNESNSIWYVFTVQNSGKFGFLLTPNSPSSDYDWALFNITGASCADILLDERLLVSCNAAGGNNCNGLTGATGDSEYNAQGMNCNNFPPTLQRGYSPFNDLVDVDANNTYVLMINNYEGSAGYSLDFGLSSDIGIFDVTPPEMKKAGAYGDCDGSKVEIEFSEFIQCNTIDQDNFELIGPGGPFDLRLNSTNCDAGGNFSSKFILSIDPPLPGAITDYQLSLIADGISEALDLCDNPSLSKTVNLSILDQETEFSLGNDTILCNGETLTLDLTDINDMVTWNDGTTDKIKAISVPGTYSVTINGKCGQIMDEIVVEFDELFKPEVDFGEDFFLCPGQFTSLDASNDESTYVWQDGSTDPVYAINVPGDYSVTVTNGCGSASDSIRIEFAELIDASLDGNEICNGDSLVWDVSTLGGTYLWQDGSTSSNYVVTKPGNYSVTISTGCEDKELSTVVEEVEIEILDINLGIDTLICPGDTLVFSFGELMSSNFLWSDSSTNYFLTVTEPGIYGVTVNNGCSDDSDQVQVGFKQPIELNYFNDTVICDGPVLLDASYLNATSFRWSDNSTEPTLLVNKPGTYDLTVAGECGETATFNVEVSKCVRCEMDFPSIFSPNGDGQNDIFTVFSNCNLKTFHLKIFNRWGNLIFETSDPDLGWNGTDLKNMKAMDGVYIWMIEFEGELKGIISRKQFSGDVTLVR